MASFLSEWAQAVRSRFKLPLTNALDTNGRTDYHLSVRSSVIGMAFNMRAMKVASGGARTEARTEVAEAGCCEVYYVDADRVGSVREAMLPDNLLEQVADTFKILAHPTRLKILRALATEELCVCDLAQVLGLSVSAVSHQLRSMREMKLVRFRSEGKLVYYSLRDRFVMALLEDAIGHLDTAEAAG